MCSKWEVQTGVIGNANNANGDYDLQKVIAGTEIMWTATICGNV